MTGNEATSEPLPQVVIHRREGELSDSIEIGTPSKGGALKVYFDASKPEDAAARIESAYKLLVKARETMGVQ